MSNETTETAFVPKSAMQMTLAELQHEIWLLQAELHRRVCGDPRLYTQICYDLTAEYTYGRQQP